MGRWPILPITDACPVDRLQGHSPPSLALAGPFRLAKNDRAVVLGALPQRRADKRYPIVLRLIHGFTAVRVGPMLAGRLVLAAPKGQHGPDEAGHVDTTHGGCRFTGDADADQAAAAAAELALCPCGVRMPVSGFAMVFSALPKDSVFARKAAPLPAAMATITRHFGHGRQLWR